jgi:Lar family restriction alleviation protein
MAHTPELLPCPFCGEKDELYPSYRLSGASKPYGIDCLGCGIDFTPREGMDVIAAWNRRAALASREG